MVSNLNVVAKYQELLLFCPVHSPIPWYSLASESRFFIPANKLHSPVYLKIKLHTQTCNTHLLLSELVCRMFRGSLSSGKCAALPFPPPHIPPGSGDTCLLGHGESGARCSHSLTKVLQIWCSVAGKARVSARRTLLQY